MNFSAGTGGDGDNTLSIVNSVQVDNTANGFAGINSMNMSSGYFNNAASQTTFGFTLSGTGSLASP